MIRRRRWKFGDCEYLEATRQLVIHGQAVKSESKPLEVLQYLLERPKQIVPKEEFLDAVWTTNTTEQSLTTAVSKLRKALGPERADVLIAVSGVGYRMGVPVTLVEDEGPEMEETFRLKTGDAIPGRPNWIAETHLGLTPRQNVWTALHRKTREVRVFKFATDGVRLRMLQREMTLSRIFQERLPQNRGFLRVLEWNFEESPFWIESEYSGLNLYEFSETEAFKAMSLRQKIDLAAQLVEILAAAHGLGILHNDLKPSNILVVSADGADGEEKQWQVKVVDFGVGSFTHPERLLEMQITHHDAFNEGGRSESPVGTAMYLAPELRVAGAIPDVLGDVYALGVILYQIVCGDFLESPEPGWELRVAEPLLRQDIADAAQVDAKLRLRTAAELADRLRKLDERREEACRQEAAEARRLKDEQALRRMRQRRPWLIATAAALVLGLAASLWSYRQANHERDAALAAAAHSRRIERFLRKIFEGGGDAGPSQDMKVVTLLDSAAKDADALSNDPASQADFYETLGNVYGELSVHDRADELLGKSLQIRSRLFGADSTEAAQSLTQIALLKGEEHDSPGEKKFADQAMEIAVRKLPASEPVRLRAEAAEAAALLDLGENARSADLLRSVIQREWGRPELLADISDAENNLAIVEGSLGQLDAADEANRQSLEIDRKLEGDRHPDIADHLMSMAAVNGQRGRYGEAVDEAREALEIERSWFGEENPETVRAITALAQAEDDDNKYQEAMPLFRAALDKDRKLFPEASRPIGQTLVGLARAEANSNQVEAAEAHYHEALGVYRALYPQGHLAIGVTHFDLGRLYLRQHLWEKSEKVLRDATEEFERDLPSNDLHTVESEAELGHALLEQKQYVEAERSLLSAQARSKAQTNKSSREADDAENICNTLNRLYTETHRPEKLLACKAGAH